MPQSKAPALTHSNTALREILRKIQVFKTHNQIHNHRHGLLAVFDLDSTLFDVGPRLQKVLLDFASVPQHQMDFAHYMPYFQKLSVEPQDWGLKSVLHRIGLKEADINFQMTLKKFWREKFFSNPYLEYDIPYDGAVEFTQQIYQLGCKIVYLTGRDVLRMGKGSLNVLKKWNFPIEIPDTELVLKPKQGMDDAEFKRDWFSQIIREDYTHIWFFENEPANIHLVRKDFPDVEVLFFASTHSGKAEPPLDIEHIMHFLIDKAASNESEPS